METLREKLWPIVKEYTRQVTELMQCREWHWVGTDDDGKDVCGILDIDGCYFLSWEDVQIIVDKLDVWVARFGSTEAVADEVRGWQEWWVGNHDSDSESRLVELWESRRERFLRTRPYINLEHWLMGCPREKRQPTMYDQRRELTVKMEFVKELMEKYRDARTLTNVFDNLGAELKELEASIAKHEKEADKRMRESQAQAFRDFEEAINNEANHGKEGF
jgi:hypothetical protein